MTDYERLKDMFTRANIEMDRGFTYIGINEDDKMMYFEFNEDGSLRKII